MGTERCSDGSFVVPSGTLWKSPEGQVSLAEEPTPIPPGSVLLFPLWYLATIRVRDDGRLWMQSRTPLLGSAAAAERARQSLGDERAELHQIVVAYDPRDAEDREELRGVLTAARTDDELAGLQ